MTEENCKHYWIIEPPDGPTSKGECIFCHKVRDFFNSIPEARLNPYLEVMEPPSFAEVT